MLVVLCGSALSAGTPAGSDINGKIEQLDIDTATLEDVIGVLGEPQRYLWGKQVFTKNNLPRTYIAEYPDRLRVVMSRGKISEIRFHEPGYLFRGKVQVGSTLDQVLEVVGEPKEIIEGQAKHWKDRVLYKDIRGKKGYCYYKCADQNVRFFFTDGKVGALYLTRSEDRPRGRSVRTVERVSSVKEYDDVRSKDLSKLDLSAGKGLVVTLTFNEKTVWPEPGKMPPGPTPKELVEAAMNPGLGVRKLHDQRITGKGVNVAIIDQPLYLDHPEFAGKIISYHDVGCGTKSSMHGPAVASLLVGTKCGTAPGASVHYVAAPSWTKDAAYYAKALDWIIEQNAKLPASRKIRVVSVSAAPSGKSSPFDKNKGMWDQACTRAEAQGILVLDCTRHRGLIGPCWYDRANPESVTKCRPGFPGSPGKFGRGRILVPSSPRTTAEEYTKGDCSYQYCGRGGLSWAIPYCSGVLAMGWQVRPEADPAQMVDLLFESAHRKSNGAGIINPRKFIRLVKQTYPHRKRRGGR